LIPINVFTSEISEESPVKEKEKIKLTLKEAKEKRKILITELQHLQNNSTAKKILDRIYSLNKANPKKMNDNLIKIVSDELLLLSAFEKVKRNKGALTVGTNLETVDTIDINTFDDLSRRVKNSEYKWSPVRRVFIPKPGKKVKRPLGIPNINDKIIQETIRITLNAIYEPSFQKLEVNFGFRPQRSVEDAILKISEESQGMTSAIEGDISGAYDNVDFIVMKNILKEKISDKKFLKLVQSGFYSGIVDKGKIKHSMTGVPQGGIASPILFNIYMHKFDKKVIEIVNNHLQEKNITENRSDVAEEIQTSAYKKNQTALRTTRQYMDRNRDSKKIENIIEYRNRNKLRKKLKTIQLNTKALSQKKRKLFFSYTRYADDWLILTNADINTCNIIKSKIAEWLKTELKLTLTPEKTLVTNLRTDAVKFLGFSFKYSKGQRVQTYERVDTKRPVRRRLNVGPCFSIDQERVLKRLKIDGIINEKFFPIHCTKFLQKKPWEIVRKYSEKIKGLYNYYFHCITNKSILNYYYYLYRYSCLKTIANIQKSSIRKVLTKYGNSIKIPYITFEKEKGIEKKVINYETFPKSSALMSWCLKLSISKDTELIERRKQNKYKKTEQENKIITSEIIKNGFVKKEVNMDGIYKHTNLQLDPFQTTKLNLRTGFKMFKYCVICGAINSKNNPIQSHHVNAIKNREISGFSLIMKSLNRKTITCCFRCHHKIHTGQYNGIALSEFYDPLLAQI
jgi:retron-type reverse transcriptase